MIVGVTGGSGFIGRHLIEKLLEIGFDVKIISLGDATDLPKKIKHIKGDLVKKENLSKFLKDVDILVHLAAKVTPPDDVMMLTNTMSTFNLISEALNYPIKQIIFSSSVVVYGNGKKEKFKEIDECFPNTVYGLSKHLSEKIILYWEKATGKPVTIFRPFNVYGPGNYKGIIYSFLSSIKNEGKVFIHGDGKQVRDFMYVDDFVNAIVKAIKTRKNGIFNLGNLHKYTILEIFELFKKIMDKNIRKTWPNGIEVNFDKGEEGKVLGTNQDLSYVKKVLKWEAKVSIEEGLRKTINWYENK